MINDIASEVGSQSVSVVLDVKKKLSGEYEVYTHNGSKRLKKNPKFADNCFFHYIEQKVGVPYRYNKEFEGVMVNGNEKKKLTFNYYVRDIKNNINL